MHQNIPNKPSWLSDKEWSFILDRDQRQCFQVGECRRNNGFAPCHSDLDTDHRQCKFHGGDDSFANARLACLDWNRGRPVEPDAYWRRTGWFDREFFPRQLRDIQLIAGYDQFVDQPLANVLFNEPDKKSGRNALIHTTTLLPGATGIGKTMLALGVLFGINHEVKKREPRPDEPTLPRVSRLLWLTPDTTLRDHTAVELAEEPVEFGLTNSPPDVSVAKSFASLARGPMNADITVTCPQALWEEDGKTKRETHSEDEVRQILSMWDTIVIDECDFANDQVKRLCRLASHALKFWMTASPMSDGEFLTDCVLITKDAVADYLRARESDQCLKALAPDVVPAAEYAGYEAYIRANREEVDSSSGVGRDHVAFMAAITSVVQEADNLERRMRRENPDEWYSPHIIVRLERIDEIKALEADLPAVLKRMKDDGKLQGEGWNVESIYQGKNAGLGEKARGKYKHPFMLARNNNGQAAAKSARILLMAKIGIRGINNWPLKYVVDTTSNVGLAELIQFNIGRPIRWPAKLSHWINDESKDEFTTTTVVCLSDLLEQKQQAYAEAHKFVMEQREQLAEAGFNTWDDILNGRPLPLGDIIIDTAEPPFTNTDKINIRVGLGEAIDQGVDVTDPAVMDKIVCRLQPTADGKRRERATEYADRLITDKEFRDMEVPFSTSADVSAVGVVAKLKPQETYDADTLIRFVKWEDSYAALRAEYVERLSRTEPDQLIVHSVSKTLKNINEHNYREIEKSEPLSKVIGVVAGELLREFNPHNGHYVGMPSNDIGRVKAAVYQAAKALFGMEGVEAKDDGPMDKRPYHVAIQVRYRQKIKDMATGRLVDWGLIPAYSRLRDLG
jgi:hypothetical protein